MAHSQTNNVLLYVRMYAVTEKGVVGGQVDFHTLAYTVPKTRLTFLLAYT